MRILLSGVLITLLSLCLPAAAQRPNVSTAEKEVLSDVHLAIEHRDCKRAVTRLNDGLAKKFPDVLILAGSMYEQGLCLKPSWERAERMYQLAHEGGHPAGRLRLIAGLAHQRRDAAAALWWTNQYSPNFLPAECRVNVAVIKDDPDAFVATLQRWPAGRVDACSYVAGVMATVAGEVENPGSGMQTAREASLRMDFEPAKDIVEWTVLKIEPLELMGGLSGDALRDRSTRSLKESYLLYLRSISSAALKRYERPATGVDPTWRLEQAFEFSVRYNYR